MKETVTKSRFIDSFRQSDTYKDNFSYAGLVALFEYLEEYEESTGEELELDVVAICCDFSEYETAREAAEEYNGAVEENEDFDEEDKENAAIAWLEDQTTVIKFDGGLIVGQF